MGDTKEWKKEREGEEWAWNLRWNNLQFPRATISSLSCCCHPVKELQKLFASKVSESLTTTYSIALVWKCLLENFRNNNYCIIDLFKKRTDWNSKFCMSRKFQFCYETVVSIFLQLRWVYCISRSCYQHVYSTFINNTVIILYIFFISKIA